MSVIHESFARGQNGRCVWSWSVYYFIWTSKLIQGPDQNVVWIVNRWPSTSKARPLISQWPLGYGQVQKMAPDLSMFALTCVYVFQTAWPSIETAFGECLVFAEMCVCV